jgi:signal transduction histidine kinase
MCVGAGDQVLQHVAHCLTGGARKADTVSRHGGDEFLILLAPYCVGDQLLTLTISIGISLYPDHGETASTLIERADLAMYHAKHNGLGSFVYNGAVIGGDGNLEAAPPALAAAHENSAATDSAHRHAYLREANEHLIMAAISAQDLQAAAEQAQRRQAEFLAILAHELRNPLAPISLAATLLGYVGNDAPQLQELQLLINRQVTRMSRLLDDLFDVARVNSGKLTIAIEVLDINALVREVINTYTPLVQKRRQQLLVQAPLAEILIQGDPGRLAQIFGNLLDNASKYTPEGGEIKLALAINGGALVMTFSDSGIGIMAEALPHIFEPFVQDPTAASFNNDGLGIGLTVVRELVEAHHGSITACSAGRGLGSQFVVTLPLLNAQTLPLQDACLSR